MEVYHYILNFRFYKNGSKNGRFKCSKMRKTEIYVSKVVILHQIVIFIPTSFPPHSHFIPTTRRIS